MDSEKTSRIPRFFRLKEEEKIKIIENFSDLTEEEIVLVKEGFLKKEIRNSISENVIGSFSLPYSIATNFLINNKDYFIPMVTEEPSVVAAASYGAKLTRDGGGIFAENLEDLMIGQIYFTNLKDSQSLKIQILENKEEIINFANKQDSVLGKLGGGVKDLEIKLFDGENIDSSLRIHLLIDVKDAMGANIVNLISEKTALFIENLVGIKSTLKIVSNLANRRLVKVKALVTKEALEREGFDTEEVIDNIVKINSIGKNDIYRSITDSKGVLNGMGAVALATGNDWRALEAGAYGYSLTETYKPLVDWKKTNEGLAGEMVVPVVVGIIGGIIQSHPLSKISLKILKVKTAQELAQIIASVGLAQNLAALRALASEGITRGHREVWAENVAMSAGIDRINIEKISQQMIKENNISIKRAKEIND